jgi:aminomethyltransferase
MGIEDTPLHVTGMERLVEPGAEYIGKPALERLAAEGVDRKLVGVEIGGEPLSMWLEDFWPVRPSPDGALVGRLTSAARSFRLQKNIGYAWVPIALAEAGTALTIDSPDGPLPATVAPLPFWDPAKDVPKS